MGAEKTGRSPDRKVFAVKSTRKGEQPLCDVFFNYRPCSVFTHIENSTWARTGPCTGTHGHTDTQPHSGTCTNTRGHPWAGLPRHAHRMGPCVPKVRTSEAGVE